MKRKIVSILTAASLGVFLFTGVVWLRHAVRKEYHFGGPLGIVGNPSGRTPTFPWFQLRAWDGYEFTTFHPKPWDRSPLGYDDESPEFMQWQAGWTSQSRMVERFGFHYGHWAMIWGPIYEKNDPVAMAVFKGFETKFVVPYWFVSLVTGVLPTRWYVGRVRRGRRLRAGRCVECGYDLRGSQEACSECGRRSDAPIPHD